MEEGKSLLRVARKANDGRRRDRRGLRALCSVVGMVGAFVSLVLLIGSRSPSGAKRSNPSSAKWAPTAPAAAPDFLVNPTGVCAHEKSAWPGFWAPSHATGQDDCKPKEETSRLLWLHLGKHDLARQPGEVVRQLLSDSPLVLYFVGDSTSTQGELV